LFTLYDVVSLPGTLSSTSSSKSADLFGRVATSCLELMLSNEARRDLAETLAPKLVLGSLQALNALFLTRTRRLLTLNEDRALSVRALFLASRVQAFAMDAELEELVVREQVPIAVLGIRRILISKSLHNEVVAPESTFLNVLVRVQFNYNSSLTNDVGLVALVLTTSPFSTSIPTVLISPVVCFSMFNAKSPFVRRPYTLQARFHISLKDQSARKRSRADGSIAVERYEKMAHRV
jgi:hypothetical protein